MKLKNIRVIIKRPKEQPFMTVIENDLKRLQSIVGGYIETVTIAEDLVIICNEERKLKDMPENCNICGVDFVGPIIFVGVAKEEFANIPITYSKFRDLFKNLYEE